MKQAFLAGIAVIALTACDPAALASDSEETTSEPSAIEASVTDPARPAEDVARDGDRKPAEVVDFAGVEPGMAIAEIAPGGGYYTRILSRAVGPEGKIYALMPAFFAERPGGLDGINALAEQYGNIEVVVIDYAETKLPEPVDLVWTTENYHDLANGDIAQVNQWVFDALKPDGIYFVEDHSAASTVVDAPSTIHRIDPAEVIRQVVSTGFILEGESGMLDNPNDPGNISPRDVTDGVSSKFVMRFKKID